MRSTFHLKKLHLCGVHSSAVFTLIFFHLLVQKPNLEKFLFIQANCFIVFTCPNPVLFVLGFGHVSKPEDCSCKKKKKVSMRISHIFFLIRIIIYCVTTVVCIITCSCKVVDILTKH